MEEEPPPEQESITSLVTRLIDDGENFVRAELKLYRARLFSRIDEARNAIILAVVALSLVQAVMVAALVGLLIVLRQPLGPGGATAVVVVAGLALAGLLGWLSLDSALGYYRTVAKVHHDQRRSLFSAPLRAQLEGHDPASRIVDLMQACDSDDTLLQAQYVDVNTYLVGDILTKVDRTSMAHSLEVRAPFLDWRFLEWGMALPASLKLRGQEGKWVLRRALEPLLPYDLLHRRKQGFAMSLSGLLRRDEARVRERLLSGAMADCGLFDLQRVEALLDQHVSGRSDHAQALWLLLAFEGFLLSAEQARPGVARAAE